MAFCPGRGPVDATYKAGFNEEGKILALEVEFCLSGGSSNDYSADIAETATLLLDGAYKIENVHLHGLCLKTNFGSGTATRGFGKPQASAIIETVLDHGASVLGLDPTDLRYLNLYKKGDQTITKMKIQDDVMETCYQRLLEKSHVPQLREEIEAFNKGNKWLKRGLAITSSKGNMGFVESDDINRGLALVHIQRDGSVSVNHSGIEMGQGINTRMAQITAACLDIPLMQVASTATQSALIPNTPPTTMVATDLIGEAIVKACSEIGRAHV